MISKATPAKSKQRTAKAKKPPEAKAESPTTSLIDIPVQFGSVNINDQTARMAVGISRDSMKLPKVDEFFCERRLSFRVVLGHADDQAGQKTFLEDGDIAIEATCDTKKYSVGGKFFGVGLTFMLTEIDVHDLARFSKRQGRLLIVGNDKIPADVVDTKDTPAKPGALKVSGTIRKHALDLIFSGELLKALKQGGLNTVGDMEDFTKAGKKLADIPGIGKSKLDVIQTRMDAFWNENTEAVAAETEE